MNALPPPQNKPPEVQKTQSPTDSKELRTRRQLATRVPKRPEEDDPRPDYVQYMENLGPRNGESLLAFRKRMCIIIGMRPLLIELWQRHDGNRKEVAKALGIGYTHVIEELRAVGLSREILADHLLGEVELT